MTNDDTVKAVTEIANALNRKNGYMVSITESQVKTILLARQMLVEQIKKESKGVATK
jgi:hypothetical protein